MPTQHGFENLVSVADNEHDESNLDSTAKDIRLDSKLKHYRHNSAEYMKFPQYSGRD